jgi:hypothetical protein
MVPRERPDISRNEIKTNVKSRVEAARGLWPWQRV